MIFRFVCIYCEGMSYFFSPRKYTAVFVISHICLYYTICQHIETRWGSQADDRPPSPPPLPFCIYYVILKNLAYGRHWISQPMRIVSPLPLREKTLWRGCMILFGGQVAWYFLLRGCMIFCVERLQDFFVWRGCVIFSLTHWGCMINFSGSCVILFVKRLRDFFVERLRNVLCEEVAWFLCVKRLQNFLCKEVF